MALFFIPNKEKGDAENFAGVFAVIVAVLLVPPPPLLVAGLVVVTVVAVAFLGDFLCARASAMRFLSADDGAANVGGTVVAGKEEALVVVFVVVSVVVTAAVVVVASEGPASVHSPEVAVEGAAEKNLDRRDRDNRSVSCSFRDFEAEEDEKLADDDSVTSGCSPTPTLLCSDSARLSPPCAGGGGGAGFGFAVPVPSPPPGRIRTPPPRSSSMEC
jgi:hypothetical protein